MTAAYETQMRTSAEDWLAHRYAHALDGFLSSRDIIREYMPSLEEDFEWQTASVFTSYSMLLARLVEIDMHRSQGDDQLISSLSDQSHEWADCLQEQASTWAKLKVQSLDEMQFRNRWLNRITLAIQRVKNGKG
ncbi:hypothetical protein HQ585_08735 [candidate division KSB1 bacterium]|nr:hypothetical protein [candidate division KSB1 bacterium]